MLWKLALVAALVAGAFASVHDRDKVENDIKAGIGLACGQLNAEHSAPRAQQAISDFRWCLERLLEVDEVIAEVEAAQPKGELDLVFNKYCSRTGQMKTCLDNLVPNVVPCVPTQFRYFVPVLTNATVNILDYVCFNNGDRIALFVAEEGPECYQSTMKDLMDCHDTEIKLPNLISLTVAQRCKLYDEWSACLVKVMEKCKSKTPSNLVGSMFKHIRKATACHTLKNSR